MVIWNGDIQYIGLGIWQVCVCVWLSCILQMALGSKSDIDLLVSCIRNSVIVTSEETGQCEVVIPPPPASETCDVTRLVEMCVISRQ